MIGLYIALVWACADWVSGSRQRQRAAQIAMAACLIMLSIMSFIQVGYWRNTLTLFTHTIEVTKDNGGAHFLVAVEWLELKREDEAEKHLSMAISIAPLKGKPHNALGVIRRRQGHYDQAVELWNASIKINSSASGPYINLGDNQYRQGNADKAIELYLVAMMRISEEMPIHEVSRVADLTAWLLATRELPQYPRELALKIAISNYKRGKPDDPGKATTLAAAFAHAGQFKNAIAAIDHALKLAAKQNDPRQFARLTYYRQQFIERKPLRFRLASKAGP